MGPLIPNAIIDPSWNHVLALLLGMGFGFTLEASGFSSSRKIMGTFFGYDFVVLRVFFTAAVTTMLGVMYFDYLGIIDYSMLYIHPTYLASAITGGIVMGLGFSFGGYCPGTSYCAVAIGKIDAFVFSIGLFFGIFLFSLAYPLFETMYEGGALGAITAFNFLGISAELFVFFITIATVAVFMGAYYIQRRTRKIEY
jgi:hypothetical protein